MANDKVIKDMKQYARVQEIITNYIEANLDDVLEASGASDDEFLESIMRGEFKKEIEIRRKHIGFIQEMIDASENKEQAKLEKETV